MDTFYVVWNPAHGLPRYRHASHDEAAAEAKRLAALHVGEFFVLKAQAVAKRTEPVTLTVLNGADEIPF